MGYTQALPSPRGSALRTYMAIHLSHAMRTSKTTWLSTCVFSKRLRLHRAAFQPTHTSQPSSMVTAIQPKRHRRSVITFPDQCLGPHGGVAPRPTIMSVAALRLVKAAPNTLQLEALAPKVGSTAKVTFRTATQVETAPLALRLARARTISATLR